jgi:hypothetical protein
MTTEATTYRNASYYAAARGSLVELLDALETGELQISPDAGNILSAGFQLWVGVQEDYDALETPDANTIYLIVEA